MIQPAEPLGGDDLVMRLMYELHAHLPEDQRPLSMSDLSDEQAARARRAVHAVLSEWESAKADLAAMTTTPTDDEALVERLRRGVTWSDGKPIGAVVGEVNDPVMRQAADRIAALAAAQPVEGGGEDDLVRLLKQLAEEAPDPRPMSAAMRLAADRILSLKAEITTLKQGSGVSGS
jgi:hypothetical protein